MEGLEVRLSPLHRAFVERFLRACQSDDRIAAACLIGSHARGRADPYSDIDLMVVTTDSAYEEFYHQREAFLRSLGELVFVEDFGSPDIAFYTPHGHKLRPFTLREAQFVTGGIIHFCRWRRRRALLWQPGQAVPAL